MSNADYVAKYPRRKALKDKVEAFWLDEPKRPPGSLDSSLRKHTTLLNRLRSLLLVGPAEVVIKEIDGLTLTKYLDEIVAATVDGACRGKGDPDVAIDIIVHLHTRLTPDFLPLLLPPLLAVLSPAPAASSKDEGKDREKEEKERLAKQRLVLRIVAELAMLHAWAEGVEKGTSEVVKVITSLMSNDAQFNNLPLLSTFLKSCYRAYLGAMPEKAPDQDGIRPNGVEGAQAHNETLPDGVEELVPPNVQERFRKMFTTYFDAACKTLVKGQKRLLEQDKINHEAYIKSGEIFEDRQQNYEKMARAVERLNTGVQSLAEQLGLSPPVLPTAASMAKSGLQIVETQSTFTVRNDGPVAGGIWEDEEERSFYEDVLDLKDMVPVNLLGIKMKSHPGEKTQTERTEDAEGDKETIAAAEEAQKLDEEDIKRQLEEMTINGTDGQLQPASQPMSREMSGSGAISPIRPSSAQGNSKVDEDPVADEDEISTGPGARLQVVLNALPEAVNREMIDKLAVDFAFLNSKAARRRVVKILGDVPTYRVDLLPNYARFTAILNAYMPDVGAGLIEVLEEHSRYLQRKKHVKDLNGVRRKNVRFFAELAKFKVAKPFTILHLFKVFLDDLVNNIENVATLLESCGRFLLRNAETADTAKNMVELMRRKQAAMRLEEGLNVILENAFYTCNPPEAVRREIVELSPPHAFIHHLLHDVLAKSTLDKVLKLVRKLHWERIEDYKFLVSSFSKIWELNYGNIPYVAALVHDLQRYHPDFTSEVIDQVLEDIRSGMEQNLFKYNQRRVATVRYLGELYMYRVINAAVIFEVLWAFISFGHPDALPLPGRESSIDAIDDVFRIRLICTLLDTCGACFDSGSQRRKLDQYLVVFQLYVLCKARVPVEVDFMVSDTLEALRPKTPRLKTFEEATTAVDELIMSQVPELSDDDSESADGSDMAHERPLSAAPPMERVESTSQRSDVSSASSASVVVYRDHRHDEVDQQAAAEFDREFAKMLIDTTDNRRGEKKGPTPVFDTAVPHVKRRAELQDQTEGRMAFTLLSKRGNKQQLRNLSVPAESSIAMNIMTHREKSRAEQEQLKKLVLQNERRQDMSEKMAFQQDAARRGIKVRFNGT